MKKILVLIIIMIIPMSILSGVADEPDYICCTMPGYELMFTEQVNGLQLNNCILYQSVDALAIPESVDGKPVVEIGSGAFDLNNSSSFTVSEILLPDSVCRISAYSLFYCDVQKIILPNNRYLVIEPFSLPRYGETIVKLKDTCTTLRIEEGFLISNISGILIYAEDHKEPVLRIPNGIIEINPGVFWQRIGIESIFMPDSLIKIGESAFYECDSISSITFSQNLLEIGDWAFAFCTGIQELTFPSTLEIVGNYAFYQDTVDDTSALRKIVLNQGLRAIGESAFEYHHCDFIFVPDSVQEIGENAFLSDHECKYEGWKEPEY